MTEDEYLEDGDDCRDVESAAEFRRQLMRQVRESDDPICRMLTSLEHEGMMYNIENSMNYDDDFSDIDDLGIF